MIVRIRKIGNSAGAIFPTRLLKEMDVKVPDELEIKNVNGTWTIEKVEKHSNKKFFSEDELLSGNIYTADDDLLPENLDTEWVK